MDTLRRKSYVALYYDQIEEYQEAIEAILRAKRSGKANTHMLNNLGVAYWETGEVDKARQSFSEAIAAAPRNAVAFKNLGILEREQGNTAEAMSAFTEAVRIRPRDYSMHLINAHLFLEMGSARDAIPFFERAIALGCGLRDVRENLARAYAQSGDIAKAEEQKRMAREGTRPRVSLYSRMQMFLRLVLKR